VVWWWGKCVERSWEGVEHLVHHVGSLGVSLAPDGGVAMDGSHGMGVFLTILGCSQCGLSRAMLGIKPLQGWRELGWLGGGGL
jgi:hypothetical protein